MAVPLAIATGVFIDADHLIDNFDGRERGVKRHMWRPFHAWEYVVVGLFAYLALWNNPYFLALWLGYTSHVILDQIMNETHPLAYFITFRAMKGFKREHLTPHLFRKQIEHRHARPPFWAKVEPDVWKIVSRRRRSRRQG